LINGKNVPFAVSKVQKLSNLLFKIRIVIK